MPSIYVIYENYSSKLMTMYFWAPALDSTAETVFQFTEKTLVFIKAKGVKKPPSKGLTLMILIDVCTI